MVRFFAYLHKIPDTILRTVIAYILLFIFSLAFSYETITYFSKKISDGFQTALNDFETENEKEAGDEKEKKERKDFCFLESHEVKPTTQLKSAFYTSFIFYPSEFSQTVYSPPELAML